MHNARIEPMQLIYIGDDDSLAIGNTTRGFYYYDAKGNRLHREDAEPFYLAGTNIVIRHSLFGVEVPEVTDDSQI